MKSITLGIAFALTLHVGIAASATPSDVKVEKSRPNIVFILADDMGWALPGFNGRAREQGKTFARLGELAEVLGNLDLAAERLSKATELFPDHYEAWHRLAAIERRRGNQDAAARAANQEAAARDRVGRSQGFPE